MNHFKVLFGVLLVFALMVLPASAATITINSGDGIGETMDVSHLGWVGVNPVVLNSIPGPWGSLPGASWVSYAQTGLNGIVAPNTNDVNSPTAVLYESFFLPYGDNEGSITVGADDTASVYLVNAMNPLGLLLWAANWVQDSTCAAGPIACEQPEFKTLLLNNTQLVQGNNTIKVNLYQRAGYSFGGIVSGEIESVPEPTTMALMGIGLLALGGVFHRRRQQNNQ